VAPRTRVQEVAGQEPGVRVFVVHSEEREQYERGLRDLSMERARQELEAPRRPRSWCGTTATATLAGSCARGSFITSSIR
jgi:hypothetical protein